MFECPGRGPSSPTVCSKSYPVKQKSKTCLSSLGAAGNIEELRVQQACFGGSLEARCNPSSEAQRTPRDVARGHVAQLYVPVTCVRGICSSTAEHMLKQGSPRIEPPDARSEVPTCVLRTARSDMSSVKAVGRLHWTWDCLN